MKIAKPKFSLTEFKDNFSHCFWLAELQDSKHTINISNTKPTQLHLLKLKKHEALPITSTSVSFLFQGVWGKKSLGRSKYSRAWSVTQPVRSKASTHQCMYMSTFAGRKEKVYTEENNCILTTSLCFQNSIQSAPLYDLQGRDQSLWKLEWGTGQVPL